MPTDLADLTWLRSYATFIIAIIFLSFSGIDTASKNLSITYPSLLKLTTLPLSYILVNI